MARRLVLHIGTMKSGTSYLQALLDHNREVLREHGIDFAGDRWRQQVSAVNELIERGGPKQPPLDPDGAFERLARHVDAWSETSVISMEFLGPRERPKIDLILQRFPDTQVDVVLTARDLTRQLPAAWQEAVQNTSVATWPEYVEAVRHPEGPGGVPGRKFWRQQSVAEIAERWRSAVGHDHFVLVTVPPPGAPPALLWERFAEVLGVPADGVDLQVPRSNPSIGSAAAMVMRSLNERLARTDLSRDDYLAVAKGVLAKQGLVALGDPKLGVDAPWLEELAHEQVAALRRLGPRVVGDLADLEPRAVAGVHTDDIGAEQQLEVALEGLAFMVQQLAEARSEAATSRRQGHRRRRQAAQPAPAAAAAPARTVVRDRLRRFARKAADATRAGRHATGPVGPAAPEPAATWRAPREPGQPVRACAITFCRDEGTMLPKWIDYYGAQLGVDNLYVVDDNSTDGSTDDLPCDVLKIPPIRADFNRTRMLVVSQLAGSLMQLYDVVVFCDTDEFIVPDPDRYDSLRDYLERRTADGLDAVGSIGLNVVHHVDSEAPLDLGAPLLGQRTLAKFLPLMCKPAIAWTPASWSAGTHGIRIPYDVDPDLWMFHMKFGDLDLLQQAADHRLRMVQMDGRSAKTQWSEGGDNLVQLVRDATAGVDPAAVPDFVPPKGQQLANLVVEDPVGNWRAPRGAQKTLMEKQPLVRIPDRFHGRA